jgi:hypothetical protein
MDSISRFKKSYAVLQTFYERWLVRLGERCQGHDQRQAAYCVWARYSMSMRTLDAILDPHLIPDLSVICRGCLEFDVSLEAIIKDDNVARDYLEFDKHAKARYLKILSKQGDIDRLLMRREQFDETFGEDPDDFRRNSWCAKHQGITGLIQKLDRPLDLRLYNMLSHFAHGSIWAMQILDRSTSDPDKTLATMIENVYTSYLDSSRSFVRFAWEPLTTPKGEQCKSDFLEVETAHVAKTT